MPEIIQVSFYRAQKPSASLNARGSLTELKVVCAVAGQWGKVTDLQVTWLSLYSSGPVSRNFETMVMKWVITKGRNGKYQEHTACLHELCAKHKNTIALSDNLDIVHANSMCTLQRFGEGFCFLLQMAP